MNPADDATPSAPTMMEYLDPAEALVALSLVGNGDKIFSSVPLCPDDSAAPQTNRSNGGCNVTNGVGDIVGDSNSVGGSVGASVMIVGDEVGV